MLEKGQSIILQY